MKVNRIFENYDSKLKDLENYRLQIIKDLEKIKQDPFLTEEDL